MLQAVDNVLPLPSSPLHSPQPQVLSLLLPNFNGLCVGVPHLPLPQHLFPDHLEQTLHTTDTAQTAVNDVVT